MRLWNILRSRRITWSAILCFSVVAETSYGREMTNQKFRFMFFKRIPTAVWQCSDVLLEILLSSVCIRHDDSK